MKEGTAQVNGLACSVPSTLLPVSGRLEAFQSQFQESVMLKRCHACGSSEEAEAE